MKEDHRLGIARDLRKLASDIEKVCQDSPVMSMAYVHIAMCHSRLCAEARIIEQNVEIDRLKLPKLRGKP